MGAPPQQPFFDLPGHEFFALAQNARISMSGRKRVISASPILTVPVSPDPFAINFSFDLEFPFTRSAGIYIEDTWFQWNPQDQFGELQILSATFGLQLNNGGSTNVPLYALGIPIATTLSPAGAQVMARDQQKLINFNDMVAVQTALAASLLGQHLQITSNVFVKNNDITNTHTAVVTIAIIYHLLMGFTE